MCFILLFKTFQRTQPKQNEIPYGEEGDEKSLTAGAGPHILAVEPPELLYQG